MESYVIEKRVEIVKIINLMVSTEASQWNILKLKIYEPSSRGLVKQYNQDLCVPSISSKNRHQNNGYVNLIRQIHFFCKIHFIGGVLYNCLSMHYIHNQI